MQPPREVFVQFSEVFYHFKPTNSLSELRTGFKKLLSLQAVPLFFVEGLTGVEQVTEANYREVCRSSSDGVVRLLALLTAEAAALEQFSRSVSMSFNSSSSSEQSSRCRGFSARQPSSPREFSADFGPMCSRLMSAARGYVAAVCLREQYDLKHDQLLSISSCPLLSTLTLDHFVANSECWRTLTEVVRNADALQELRLLAPGTTQEITSDMVREMLLKSTALTLVVRKATIAPWKSVDSYSSLRELTLSRVCFLGGKRSELPLSTVLQHLDLSRSCIGLSAGLGMSLERLVLLKTLNLEGNGLGPEGVSDLSPALLRMRRLKSLNLASNFIRDSGLSQLAYSLQQCPLESLDLRWSAASASFAALNPIVFRLKSFKISHNRLSREAFAAISEALFSLEEVEIAYCGLSDEGFDRIMTGRPLPTLRLLDLSGNTLRSRTVTWAETVHRFPNIRKLRLSAIGADLSGFFHEGDPLPCLTELDISQNRSQSGGIPLYPLAQVHYLTTLRASQCDLLLTSLQRLPESLSVLDLSFNGLAVVPLFPTVISFSRLKSLNLSGNGLDSGVARLLFEGLATASNLKRLNLSYNCFALQDFATLPVMPALKSIKAGYNRLHTPAKILFSRLAAQPRLRKVDLKGNLLNLGFLAQFRTCVEWAKLNLNSNPMGTSELITETMIIDCFATVFPKLTSLKLSNTQLGDCIRPLLQTLSHYPWLQVLSLSFNSFASALNERGEGISPLPCLRVLKLAGIGGDCKKIRMVLEHLAGAKGLEVLDLSENRMGQEGAEMVTTAIKCFPGLRRLNLSNNEMSALPEEFVESLATMERLETLDLSGNALESRAAIELWKAAARKKTFVQLRELRLARNKIGNKGALYLSRVTRCLPSLTSLDLTSNAINSSYMLLVQCTPQAIVLPPQD